VSCQLCWARDFLIAVLSCRSPGGVRHDDSKGPEAPGAPMIDALVAYSDANDYIAAGQATIGHGELHRLRNVPTSQAARQTMPAWTFTASRSQTSFRTGGVLLASWRARSKSSWRASSTQLQSS
jgi:hypothetical protein